MKNKKKTKQNNVDMMYAVIHAHRLCNQLSDVRMGEVENVFMFTVKRLFAIVWAILVKANSKHICFFFVLFRLHIIRLSCLNNQNFSRECTQKDVARPSIFNIILVEALTHSTPIENFINIYIAGGSQLLLSFARFWLGSTWNWKCFETIFVERHRGNAASKFSDLWLWID